MTKLWKKDTDALQQVTDFTVGDDLQWDAVLAPFDLFGSIAHVLMLEKVGLIEKEECSQVVKGLQGLYKEFTQPGFSIPEGYEDIHSYVESLLTESLGDPGKKIHTARSRNDQVLVDTKLYLRDALATILEEVVALIGELLDLSEKHKKDLLPGYTHLQLAMPSSFGLWFGAYAESLIDDLEQGQVAYTYTNKNPLGSAAGFGSSFPIDRDLTTKLLGFDQPHINSVAAQMSRGKTERIVAQSLANIADTMSRLAMDVTLYANPHFGLVSFPKEWTTGSSIMPHKKNLDVMELIRARCNQIKALPNELFLISGNLPSGYHRDFQLTKTHLFPTIESLLSSTQLMRAMLQSIEVKKGLLDDAKFNELFSVENVNKLVQEGVPFREAYRQVGLAIEKGEYSPERELNHTHLGSIGNLGTERLRDRLQKIWAMIPIDENRTALQRLLQPM
jgi:argininosuccinate lyase